MISHRSARILTGSSSILDRHKSSLIYYCTVVGSLQHDSLIYQYRYTITYTAVWYLEVLPFCQWPGYSRVLPALLIPVTGTSNTSYSPSIWASGSRVPVSSLSKFRGWQLIIPKPCPRGRISYLVSRKTFSSWKCCFNHPGYPGTHLRTRFKRVPVGLLGKIRGWQLTIP